VLFTSNKRRLPAVIVRGDQMASELKGQVLRCRYLREPSVRASKALIWISEIRPELIDRFEGLTPQIYEPVNPKIDPTGQFNRKCRRFEFVILNTRSSLNWLGAPPEKGWRHWVIPHHHCNQTGYRLPEERLERPAVVGYLGEPEHLHDSDPIQAAIEKMGMRFLNAPANDLHRYRDIDIGIAWTRREELRDQTRSNVKLANFVAHGIPCVVCDYESYRDVDRALGGDSCLIRGELNAFIDGIAEIVSNRDLRMRLSERAWAANRLYAREEIGRQYLAMIDEINASYRRKRG
jgi:hypothetical protein